LSFLILTGLESEDVHLWSKEDTQKVEGLTHSICKGDVEVSISLDSNDVAPSTGVIGIWIEELGGDLKDLLWLKVVHSLRSLGDLPTAWSLC
jgi:hypothetical protein